MSNISLILGIFVCVWEELATGCVQGVDKSGFLCYCMWFCLWVFAYGERSFQFSFFFCVYGTRTMEGSMSQKLGKNDLQVVGGVHAQDERTAARKEREKFLRFVRSWLKKEGADVSAKEFLSDSERNRKAIVAFLKHCESRVPHNRKLDELAAKMVGEVSGQTVETQEVVLPVPAVQEVLPTPAPVAVTEAIVVETSPEKEVSSPIVTKEKAVGGARRSGGGLGVIPDTKEQVIDEIRSALRDGSPDDHVTRRVRLKCPTCFAPAFPPNFHRLPWYVILAIRGYISRPLNPKANSYLKENYEIGKGPARDLLEVVAKRLGEIVWDVFGIDPEHFCPPRHVFYAVSEMVAGGELGALLYLLPSQLQSPEKRMAAVKALSDPNWKAKEAYRSVELPQQRDDNGILYAIIMRSAVPSSPKPPVVHVQGAPRLKTRYLDCVKELLGKSGIEAGEISRIALRLFDKRGKACGLNSESLAVSLLHKVEDHLWEYAVNRSDQAIDLDRVPFQIAIVLGRDAETLGAEVDALRAKRAKCQEEVLLHKASTTFGVCHKAPAKRGKQEEKKDNGSKRRSARG